MHIVTYKTFINVRWMLYRSCVVTYKCIKHNLQAHVYTTRNLLQHVFTATLLVWRWRHSNRVRCACGQAGPGGDLRHPEELPVLSARSGIQHGRGRDNEWTRLLHTGWAMFTCITSVNSSSVLQFTTNIILHPIWPKRETTPWPFSLIHVIQNLLMSAIIVTLTSMHLWNSSWW